MAKGTLCAASLVDTTMVGTCLLRSTTLHDRRLVQSDAYCTVRRDDAPAGMPTIALRHTADTRVESGVASRSGSLAGSRLRALSKKG